jgi:hypothetical protein
MKKNPIRVSEGGGGGLDEDTQMDVSTNSTAPVHEAEIERRFRESAEKIATKHAGLFRRLSK